MAKDKWVVHKFGGTSLADADGYRRAAHLALNEGGPAAIVVSAPGGMTDDLYRAVTGAAAGDPAFSEILPVVMGRLQTLAGELLPAEEAAAYLRDVHREAADLEDILRGIHLTRNYGEPALELVSGHGELWSARLLTAHLAGAGTPATFVDARTILVVEPGDTGPNVVWETTRGNLDSFRSGATPAPWVITGYVASTPAGLPTTLKRNGSDLTASIFGALLDAERIVIWTDVNGVLSADPRRVPQATPVTRLSYAEAMELAYFGAKVLHPHTMAPAVEKGIPLLIRNAAAPELSGTRIDGDRDNARVGARETVKGFSSVEDIALVNLEGAGMIGIPGIAARVFGSLRDVGVSVIMISQASSEHSICLAVPGAQAAAAETALRQEFFAELHHRHIQTVEIVGPCSIIAAVGDRMVDTPGVAARFFGALGKAGVNVRAVAQGSSERNLSVVVDAAQSTRALRAVHAGFYLSDQTLSVGLIGPGLIGGALLQQMASRAAFLAEHSQIDLRLRGIMNSNRMVLDPEGMPFDGARERLAQGVPANAEAFAAHLHADHLPHGVILDCTADDGIAANYPGWLARGLHVITPNKKANSAPLPRYRKLLEAGRAGNAHYFYEATVGAGLPVIQTLRDLIRTGDRVLCIEGVLSGTLSYLLNRFKGEEPFSKIVEEARQLGYTEPDPREDLSGMDVARKAIILAREMGMEVELEQVPVESLVPDELTDTPLDAFADALRDYDPRMHRLFDDAQKRGTVLRYVARIDAEAGVSVGLREFPSDHAFARIAETDNIIAFTTERYAKQPLIVQGPGAGPQVTAAGVFADLLRLAAYLGAPS